MPLKVVLSVKSTSIVLFSEAKVLSADNCPIHLVSLDSPAVQLNVMLSAPRGLDELSFQIVEPSKGSSPVGFEGSH